jgi:hypothetical protein
MPKYQGIPDEFKNRNNKWTTVVSDWFFNGLHNVKWTPKDGVETGKALTHIKAIMASYEPEHEHKESGCAYLLSEWFKDVTYNKG